MGQCAQPEEKIRRKAVFYTRRAASTAFSPPKANEFDIAVRIGRSRAAFGT
jgi:hypothetical protein